MILYFITIFLFIHFSGEEKNFGSFRFCTGGDKKRLTAQWGQTFYEVGFKFELIHSLD